MSQWPTGVSVVATMTAEGPTGCTVNALSSLSLEPLELLVCFDRASETLTAAREHQRFSVNVLAREQEQLCMRFARKGTPEEKFKGVRYRLVDDVPVIDECVVSIVCEITRMLDGGDHEIVIARPIAGFVQETREPLIFFRNALAHAKPPPRLATAAI